MAIIPLNSTIQVAGSGTVSAEVSGLSNPVYCCCQVRKSIAEHFEAKLHRLYYIQVMRVEVCGGRQWVGDH